MTESRAHKITGGTFTPHTAHRNMTVADSGIFKLAAEMYAHPRLYEAVTNAGGDDAHIAHFGREICGIMPATAWAFANDGDTVKAALTKVAEGLVY